MKKFLIFFISVVFFSSCEEENATDQRWYVPPEAPGGTAADGQGELWGHWICRDFLDLAKTRQTVRTLHTRPLFIEMVFKPEYHDSVLLISAYQNFFAHYREYGRDSIVINGVLPGRNLLLFPSENMAEIDYTDILQNKDGSQVHDWAFVKASPGYTPTEGPRPSVIYAYMNEGLLAGNYTIYKGDTPQTITLGKNGAIQGWEEYNQYKLCLGGECFRLTHAPIDIIQLNGNAGNSYFGLTFGLRDSVYLYAMKQNAGQKEYAYQPTGVAYTLIKQY